MNLYFNTYPWLSSQYCKRISGNLTLTTLNTLTTLYLRTNQQTVNVTILSLFKIVMPWQFFFLAMFKFAFKTILKVLMLIPRNESQLHSADLVEHVAFELEAVARPHVLQQVDYLLPTTVLLAKIYFVLILGNSSSHQRQRINEVG